MFPDDSVWCRRKKTFTQLSIRFWPSIRISESSIPRRRYADRQISIDHVAACINEIISTSCNGVGNTPERFAIVITN
ncbi:hypothetical protein AR158_C152L [Paramecium bursaria Chlorella virus AR158]|uniref:hypothetical protein n=1 Tax=Paramecium bursaria Chlorella virus AR158 TaxID=380598 RepID=UPI00015AA810|nr:hypothetical protein AR158_C152L [Paramecium bursaria Chlorella virus AR158]ABU43698.1 hypothetical protein AR158_C152L [Paramecium bursaria Chlorella virus AR158]